MRDHNLNNCLIPLAMCALLLAGCAEEKYTSPSEQTVRSAVFTSGHIETEGQYLLISAVDGYIEESLFKEGQLVSDGAAVALISEETPQAQLEDALANYRQAKTDINPNSFKIKEVDLQIEVAQKDVALNEKLLSSYKNLLSSQAVSKIDYENQLLKTEKSRNDLDILKDSKQDLLVQLGLNLQNAENQVKIRQEDASKYRLCAKGNSILLKQMRKEGEYVRRGEVYAEMGKGDPVVKLFIEESDINSVLLGQEVELSVNTYQGMLFSGEITHIDPAFDETRQAFLVEARFREKPDRLFSGTQVQANVITSEKNGALVIPSSCIFNGNQVKTKENGTVQIELGIQHQKWVEVLSGLSKDDSVLLNPQG